MKKSRQQLMGYGIAIVLLIALDQITKWLAICFLKGKAAYTLIPGVFELRYLENQSAAFGVDPVSILHKMFHFSYFEENPEAFLTCKMVFFVIFTVIVTGIMLIILCKIPHDKHFLGMNLILAGFVSGAIGNLIDRVARNYVVDFFYFSLIDFPIFNVADIYVTVAATAMLLMVVFYYKEEDLDLMTQSIFPKQKNKRG